MNLSIMLAAVTVVATSLGGFLAIKGKDRLHLVLGLSGGLLLGLVAFDLLPEIFEMNTDSGVALGISFQVSPALGFTVFVALLAHAFSDGLNTVSLLIKSGKWTRSSLALLGVDAVMRISGAALGSMVVLSDNSVGIYLAVFSGFVIYLATSHILPEAHSRHPSRLTMLATVIGVLAMWLIVGNIGE